MSKEQEILAKYVSNTVSSQSILQKHNGLVSVGCVVGGIGALIGLAFLVVSILPH